MRAVTQIDLAQDEGWWVVRSHGATVYLLEITHAGRRMARLPGRSSSRAWWDGTWVALLQLTSYGDDGIATDNVLRVGARHRWLADPEGDCGAADWWWLSRTVSSIESLGSAEAFQMVRDAHALDGDSMLFDDEVRAPGADGSHIDHGTM